jgi:predicted component of type VI protein secretion system
VLLTLKLSAGMKPGEVGRQVFTEDGGTIGRAATNSWVLTHNKVSGRHATISFRNGVYYIQDTSRNGVSINSPDNRLVRDRPYALKSGDIIFIEPYEIDVSIDAGAERPRYQPLEDPFGQDDPFAPVRGPQPQRLSPVPPPAAGDEVDPLKFFEAVSPTAPRRPAEPVPSPVDDWLGEHYRPPVAIPDPLLPPPEPTPVPVKEESVIPADYNPLAPDSGIGPIPRDLIPPAAEPPRRPKPPTRGGTTPPRPVISPKRPAPDDFDLPAAVSAPPAGSSQDTVPPVAAPSVVEPPVAAPPVSSAPVAAPSVDAPVAAPPVPPVAAPPVPLAGVAQDLADVLAGAGLQGAPVTPELARDLGQILRVVVSGLIDVLHSRQRIKEEFRVRQTIFRPADNNPLKFSANVEDALHNLLVKRNPAYLGAVDAFADAFDDLRDHQLAMLAGMRVAFETMLAESDPDRMQEEFDRQSAKGLIPARLRYWDLYREKRQEMKKDPEATFARLFGEEFARAYEEQFRELRAQRRARAGEQPKAPRPPQT